MLRCQFLCHVLNRGGVEDTRLEAKAKDTKKIRGQGQGQPFRGQTLSRPRTGMLEAKAKDQGHKAQVLSKKKKKKVFTKIFQAISKKKKKKKDFKICQGQGLQNLSSRTSSRPRTSSRTPPLVLKALFFIKIALKLSYVCKKMQNFRALGVLPPDPPKQPPIANFWLRAWLRCFFGAVLLNAHALSREFMKAFILIWFSKSLRNRIPLGWSTSSLVIKLKQI